MMSRIRRLLIALAILAGIQGTQAATNQIYGYVADNLSNPVAGVDVSASNSVGNVYSSLTDGTGYYSINVTNGTWDVSVDCGELTSLGYDCTNDQEAVVSGGSVEEDFTVDQSANYDDLFTYETNNDTITIDGYNGTSLDVTIPGTITGLPVTGIGGFAFNDYGMTNVTIPGSVTSIGDSAFSGTSLTGITIPNSVTNIGIDPFGGCSSLTAINVTAGDPVYVSVAGVLFNVNQTTLIQYPAGNGVTTYSIPNSVTSIADDAFYGCFSLTSIAIPNLVTNIGEGTFAYCSSLASVTIPASVTNIEEEAFFGCNGLTAINVDAGNPAFMSIAGVLFDHSETTLLQYPAGNRATTYGIPNGVTSIGAEAFFGCFPTSVTIPNSVTSIGESAFAGCSRLTGLYFEGNAPSADPTAFDGDSVTAYYLNGSTGWSSPYDGLTTALAAPQLAILHSGTNVILTWPTNATGYALQSATNLASPVWSGVSPAPAVVNMNYTVTNGIAGSRKFYRLDQ